MQINIYGRGDMPCGPSWALEIDGHVIAKTYSKDDAKALAGHIIASTCFLLVSKTNPLPSNAVELAMRLILKMEATIKIEDYTGHE